MSTSIGSIFRSLQKKDRYNILTFPFEPIADSYWDLAEENIYLWTNDCLSYDPKLLPATTRKVMGGLPPIGVPFDLIIANNQKTWEIGSTLSRLLHIPLCYWFRNIGPKPPAHYYIFSSANIRDKVGGIGPIFGAFYQKKEQIDRSLLLCREEYIPVLSKVIDGRFLVPLEVNFYKRQEQYRRAAAIFNIYNDLFLPELVECQSVCPVFSVPTPYHNVLIFKNDKELKDCLNNKYVFTPKVESLSPEVFNYNLHNMLENMEGIAFEPF